MKLFEIFGNPVKVSNTRRLTSKEIILSGIERQLEILEGKSVKNKDGRNIRSWFTAGSFVPMVGNRPLFGQKLRIAKVAPSDRMTALQTLRLDVQNGSCDPLLLAIDEKRAN